MKRFMTPKLMSKGIRRLMVIMAAAAMLAACGSSDEDASSEAETGAQTETGAADAAYSELQAEIDAVDPKRPESLGEIELGEYKGIAVDTQAAAEITDDDALLFIEENVLPYYLEETDEPAAEGLTVNIDFVGKMDGEEFSGGSAEGQTFVLGMGGYIDGFEDGIIGMTAGETKDVEVTFPEDYTEELAGKDAVFTITLNSVQKERVLDDKLANELNNECSTRDEYIEFVRSELQAQEDLSAEFVLYDNAVNAVIDGCAVLEPSEEAVNWRMDEMIVSDDNMLRNTYGIGLADYISVYGFTLDDYKESIRETCESQVRQYLVTEAVCDAEGLDATEEELENWAEANNVDMATVNETYDEDEINIRCRAWLAAKLIAENADVSYLTGEELAAETETAAAE